MEINFGFGQSFKVFIMRPMLSSFPSSQRRLIDAQRMYANAQMGPKEVKAYCRIGRLFVRIWKKNMNHRKQ